MTRSQRISVEIVYRMRVENAGLMTVQDDILARRISKPKDAMAVYVSLALTLTINLKGTELTRAIC